MPARELHVPFPLKGVSHRRGYQSSDPQTTRGSANVVPDDSGESRTRGGTRPGVTKRYSTAMENVPQFLIRVSASTTSEVYEYLCAGTAQNIYLGQSVPSGNEVPVVYTEQLSPLSGEIATEAGEVLQTEGGDDLVISEFELAAIERAVVTDYHGNVILGSEGAELASGSSGSLSGTTLTDSGVADWTALGIDIAQHWVEITSSSSDVDSGTYRIASVSSGAIELETDPFNNGTGPEACEYAIVKGVQVLNPSAPSVSLLTPSGGYVPLSADAVAIYRDRVVWGVGRTWYMSRQGDAGDYDYGADPEDPARAIAGTASEAGEPADPIVAMASAGFDYLLIFAENSVWNMRGDPGYGGQLYELSRTVGCVASKAWCYGESTDVFFLAKDGLYYIPPNAGGPPQALSPDLLPRDLQGVDRTNHFVTLAYDPEDDGVLIFVVPRQGTAGSHWWYDIDTHSFWPIEFANNRHQPIDAVTFGGAPTRVRRVVLACVDGFLREWTGTSDDGGPIASHLILGPYQLGELRDLEGMLTELVATLDEGAGSVTLEVYVADSAEDAVAAAETGSAPSFSDTVSGGRSFTMRPRTRGVAFCIRLASSDAWALEAAHARLASVGKRR